MAPAPQLYLSGDEAADRLLAEDPLALVIGLVLDQQVPLEKAFHSPLDLKGRLGGVMDAASLAAMDPDRLANLFADRPALHRFPRSMAGRVQEVCRVIVDDYDGDPAAIWTSATDGQELLRNVKALPGFGEQKARIFVALLGKQLGVRPPRWREAAGPFGQAGSFRSIADIDSAASLAKVRLFKQQAKAAAKAASAAPADKAPVKKTPVKKTPVKKTPAKRAPAKRAPVAKKSTTRSSATTSAKAGRTRTSS